LYCTVLPEVWAYTSPLTCKLGVGRLDFSGSETNRQEAVEEK